MNHATSRRWVVAATVAAAIPASAQLTWTYETAASSVSIANGSPALALGSGGTAGIAYFTSDGEVNYASRTGGGVWSTGAGIENRGTFNYLGLSLKLTSGGDPRIAFFTVAGNAFDARYASRTGGVWSVEDIATTGAAGEYVHLALAGDGTARVAYGTSSNSLNYGTRASGSWANENITTNGIPAFLRLGAGDVPYVAFHDAQDTGNLRVASNPSGTSWVYATAVTGFAGTSSTVSFRLKGADAGISWVEGGALKLATSNGGVWSTETIVASGVENAATSLAFDGAGSAYVSYQTATNSVRVAYYDGGWNTSTIADGSLGVAQGESLDYLGGTLALSYITSGGDLGYAFATVSAVPEPSTYAAILGVAALGLAVRRRAARGRRMAPASSAGWVAAVALALVRPAGAEAVTIQSGSYTMNVDAGSTMSASGYNDYATFGMGESPFKDPNSSAYFFPGFLWGNGHAVITVTRTLSATFTAEPGKIFDEVYVGLTPGAFTNWQSGVWSTSTWAIHGGTYHGDMSGYSGNPASYHDWTITGPETGNSFFYDGYWYHGSYATWGGIWGTPEYLTGSYLVGANTFSVDLSISASTWNDAAFNPPGLQLFMTYRDAPVGAPSVPDAAPTLALLVPMILGLVARPRGRRIAA